MEKDVDPSCFVEAYRGFGIAVSCNWYWVAKAYDEKGKYLGIIATEKTEQLAIGLCFKLIDKLIFKEENTYPFV